MNQGVRTIIYPVKDIARAKALFRKLLGVEPHADYPGYVGFSIGGQEIGLVPNAFSLSKNAGMTAFYHVDDIKQSLQSLQETGAQVQQEVKDVGGGRLTAVLRDGDGNIIGLIQDVQSKSP